MFNKRESSTAADEASAETAGEHRLGAHGGDSKPVRDIPPASGERRGAAVIGPSIHIEGDLRGEEDLVIEGEVKGTVKLKSNSVTIGARGKVAADVYAHTIYVEGSMKGDLFAAERISIRKNAQVRGNITSPRVSLEDGAHFKGSIEMDAESEALKSAFGDTRQKAAAARPAAQSETAKTAANNQPGQAAGAAPSAKPGGEAGKSSGNEAGKNPDRKASTA